MQEAVQSVLKQTYQPVECILVDDGSTDDSKEVLSHLSSKYQLPFVSLEAIHGNCVAFNRGWMQSKGEFIIDLAADDVLMPQRVALGVSRMQSTGAGIHYSDVALIDPQGVLVGKHETRSWLNTMDQLEGDLYAQLVAKYFINAASMMFRRGVLESLGGYDEQLAYEDFDFWVRSARQFEYCFTEEFLVKKRIVEGSLSTQQTKWKSVHLTTNYLVCQKIQQLNQTAADRKAFRTRVWTEMKQALKWGRYDLAVRYLLFMFH